MEKEVSVLNRLGLHARPASEFVRTARAFKATIHIRRDGEMFSAGSILEVLMANLDCGTKMTLVAEGPDAEKALDRLGKLLEEFRTQEE